MPWNTTPTLMHVRSGCMSSCLRALWNAPLYSMGTSAGRPYADVRPSCPASIRPPRYLHCSRPRKAPTFVCAGGCTATSPPRKYLFPWR